MRRHIIIILLAALVMATGAEAAKPRQSKKRQPAKPTPEQILSQAKALFDDYRFDEALEALEEIETPESESLRRRAELGSNMLGRVEQVAIVDSITLPRIGFSEMLPQWQECGKVFDPTANTLPLHFLNGTTAFATADGKRYIFTSPDDSGRGGYLASSYRLVDGSLEQPADMGAELHAGAVAEYPYLLSDGITLYFAADGEGSLGGLDIYMSRSNGSEFLQPQNLGMPYNSPYDDYMMGIDETTGYGFWLTDRNQIPDSVTMYIFRVNDMRRNYAADDANLIDRARITSVAATLADGTADPAYMTAYAAMRHSKASERDADYDEEFAIAVPGRGIITSREMLSSQMGRDALDRYLKCNGRLRSAQQELSGLRDAYRSGNHSVSARILALEAELPQLKERVIEAANAVIRAESTTND